MHNIYSEILKSIQIWWYSSNPQSSKKEIAFDLRHEDFKLLISLNTTYLNLQNVNSPPLILEKQPQEYIANFSL